jgi:(R,R)-butanediol dehydrogenase/meso-butanediol dehydrogenase/diacetyl reductase
MKALRWYAKKDVRYEDVPEPSPGPGQLKIKVDLAGICGTDLKEYADGPVMVDASKVPIILGHEFVGKIAKLGEGVTDFKVGERVAAVGYWYCGECYFCKRGMYNICSNAGFTGLTTDGCMAEYVVIPSYAAYKLPDSVSDEAGALVEPLAVAFHAVRQGNVRLGDRVAIVGAGTIGLSVLLAAKAAGASEVYIIDKIKHRGEVALAMGATAFINPDQGDPTKQIKELTDGIGVDVSIECVGVQVTAQLALGLTRNDGTTVIVGVFGAPASVDLFSLMFYQKKLVGSPIYVDEARTVVALLADGRLDASRLVTATVPLKDAAKKGFEKLIQDKEGNIKILLQIS